jgi:hypothetical protein
VRQVKLVSNSTDSQLAEANRHFQAVERFARDYELHQGRSNDLLRSALIELYTFGEMLCSQQAEPGRSLIKEFVISKGLPWNAVTQRNPYNAFVKLAFQQTRSSHAQYAAVLAYASDSRVAPLAFGEWLKDGGGIAGRYPQALDHFGSARKQRNSQERASRLKMAQELLAAREHSDAVALPDSVIAQEGFALVLARIDGRRNAAIIDVVETDVGALEPVLLRYAPTRATAKAILAAEPLGKLYRAIDLVLGCTADKPNGCARNILIVNTLDRGRPVCRIDAVSTAYTYAWAGMVVSGHIDGVPPDVPYVLCADDAVFFRREFPVHEGWAISCDPIPCIGNSSRGFSLKLDQLLEPTEYRVGFVPAVNHKPVSSDYEQQQAVLKFIGERRSDHERMKTKERRVFSPILTLRSAGGALEIGLPNMLAVSSTLGSSSPDRDLCGRALNTNDLINVLSALAPYETNLEGTFIDTDVHDAGLCLRAQFDDDSFRLVMPTRSGQAINQSCVDLQMCFAG